MTGLYQDDDGNAISTHSMLKTFRRCPKQAQYKYKDRLKPKVQSKPLTRGTWMHSLLEMHHSPGNLDWRDKHAELSEKFEELFDEEKEELGDLPRECARLMRSYLWHYRDAGDWKVLDVEFTLETPFPDESIYRGKIDALVEWRGRLYLVDHKTHKTLPDLNFRLMDAQSALYIWAAIRNKIPVEGFIWNYLKTVPPTIPKVLKDGSRFYAKEVSTDYLTYARAVKAAGFDKADYQDRLDYYKGLRYKPGEPQLSEFFLRSVLEKSPDMLKRVAKENYHTSKRMHTYDFENTDAVERVVDRSCNWMCSYPELCTIELLGGDTRLLRKQKYREGDPLEYYQDKAGERLEEIT